MSFLEINVSGAVLISAVAILRRLFLNRLPKRTPLLLWSLVFIRLTVPLSIPSQFSAGLFPNGAPGLLP